MVAGAGSHFIVVYSRILTINAKSYMKFTVDIHYSLLVIVVVVISFPYYYYYYYYYYSY